MFWNEFRIHKTSKLGLFVNEIKLIKFLFTIAEICSYIITTVREKTTFTSTIGKRYLDLILGSGNNSKYNKNTISLAGLFIIGMIYGLGMGLVFSSRFGWITQNQGTLYIFMLYCSIPVLLPVIYFMRNPKHLKTVLQDHKLTWFVKRRKFEE